MQKFSMFSVGPFTHYTQLPTEGQRRTEKSQG